MNKVEKTYANYANPISILHDIEDVKLILTEEEVKKINTLFNSLDNFNQITEQLENEIIKNNITEKELRILFKSIKKLVNHRIENNLRKTIGQKKKLGLTQTFFELPEIISKRLSLYKS
jgi:hypothetical protein